MNSAVALALLAIAGTCLLGAFGATIWYAAAREERLVAEWRSQMIEPS